jgi:hypothetical protein
MGAIYLPVGSKISGAETAGTQGDLAEDVAKEDIRLNPITSERYIHFTSTIISGNIVFHLPRNQHHHRNDAYVDS